MQGDCRDRGGYGVRHWASPPARLRPVQQPSMSFLRVSWAKQDGQHLQAW